MVCTDPSITAKTRVLKPYQLLKISHKLTCLMLPELKLPQNPSKP